MKILVFGASIARGAFDTSQGGWVERLKAHYLDSYKDLGVGVYNLSVSSCDSASVLKFMENDISKIKHIEDEELMIIIEIGGNDCRRLSEHEDCFIPLDIFEDNLKKIMEIGKKYTTDFLFVGCCPVNEALVNPYNESDEFENEFFFNKDAVAYDVILEQIAKQENAGFISLQDVIQMEDLPDGMHPNAKGHEKIYELVKESLGNKLKFFS